MRFDIDLVFMLFVHTASLGLFLLWVLGGTVFQ